ncbi:MAG TPA: efflux RND transporter periplasmic adaptor subunit [Thiobacillus sp.]|nr:MAG: efflux transporter periplasmic adaptor subunit [Hydrogenophilales bacterium 28-61-11]OYZ56536.1 MAG: efflux transporter periplasmic adaptor subunit [Hydrogenophilales bacterium 16-61-112]OZA42882.1 MAG: efflux transporter periplasmic adaptor subunit [Hydrogenophilales bacterium 17-61-76]HQT31726.1 efflux RND transporter periplasmic adaptor subunit [Thiobacillus sp.]HQT69659.1 efflux RND transporter periplasmic adaptor subunit [Thiobacillus sp.]
MKKTGLIVLLLLAVAAAGWWWNSTGKPAEPQFRTETVARGEISAQVSANGTLNPVTLVNVGTQVSGTVRRIEADFNQQVKAGQILAELDPALFQAALAQSTANLTNTQAQLGLAEANAARMQKLFKQEYVSRQELDQVLAARAQAAAQVRVARAQVTRDQTNLGFTVIRSPVDGTVINRQVDVGQTVAASFQTPTLFLIGKDLTQMQIDSTVSEADIGQVKVGQPVRFLVDAFPDAEYSGAVRQVRLNATAEQNVVTYNVVVNVANPDLALMPGMTANLRIEVETRPNVLRVPTAALRYRPKVENSTEGGGKPRGAAVHVLVDGKPQRVAVKTGISDKAYTEIVGGKLKAGDAVIMADLAGKQDSANMPRGRLF